MFGLVITVGLLVVLVVAIRVSSTYEVKHGLINLRKDMPDETLPLSDVRTSAGRSAQNEVCVDRVLLGAVA